MSRKPSSSSTREAIRQHSVLLLHIPPSVRPDDVPPITDARRLVLACHMTQTLAPMVATYPDPPTRIDARRSLTGWTRDIGYAIEESSRAAPLVEALQEAWPLTQWEWNAWMAGRWSTRRSLTESLWRLGACPHTIGAAEWLHTAGTS